MELGGKWKTLGGILLFMGLLLFTLIFSGFSSGFLSHSFAQSAVTNIVNYTVAQDELNNIISSTNTSGLISAVTSKLDSQISYVNCGMGCLASAFVKDSTGINIPMNNNDIYRYEAASLVAAVAGAIILFFSYKKEKKLIAIGKNMVSMAIISIVLFYIPLSYIIPFLLAFPVANYSIKIPAYIFAGFSSALIMTDIAIIIAGVVLMALAAIVKRMGKTPVQNTGTKLIVAQK